MQKRGGNENKLSSSVFVIIIFILRGISKGTRQFFRQRHQIEEEDKTTLLVCVRYLEKNQALKVNVNSAPLTWLEWGSGLQGTCAFVCFAVGKRERKAKAGSCGMMETLWLDLHKNICYMRVWIIFASWNLTSCSKRGREAKVYKIYSTFVCPHTYVGHSFNFSFQEKRDKNSDLKTRECVSVSFPSFARDKRSGTCSLSKLCCVLHYSMEKYNCHIWFTSRSSNIRKKNKKQKKKQRENRKRKEKGLHSCIVQSVSHLNQTKHWGNKKSCNTSTITKIKLQP